MLPTSVELFIRPSHPGLPERRNRVLIPPWIKNARFRYTVKPVDELTSTQAGRPGMEKATTFPKRYRKKRGPVGWIITEQNETVRNRTSSRLPN